ncbi:hypothetical protein C8J57DRAFT_1230224 [Mycena rebaudengoi]|nr:hypothetical protein C8J57DRAFT_1230224 [Mycena rebaudengoi]
MSKSETHPFRPAPPRYRAALLKSADPTVAATRGTASRAKTPQKGAIRRIADTLVESQRCSFFCPEVAALNGGTAAVALAFPDTQFFKGIPYLKEISYPSHPMCAPAVYAQIQRPSGTQAGVTNPAVLQAANTPQTGPTHRQFGSTGPQADLTRAAKLNSIVIEEAASVTGVWSPGSPIGSRGDRALVVRSGLPIARLSRSGHPESPLNWLERSPFEPTSDFENRRSFKSRHIPVGVATFERGRIWLH